MSDLHFEVQAQWSGTGKSGEGQLLIGEKTIQYSAPANMGGKGVGVSPEDLLIGAVTSCYSGTLFGILNKQGLPVRRISLRAEGIITGYPSQTKFSRIVVHPTIFGGDEARKPDYEQAAVTSCDRCFIGKSISGNIDYEVGTVTVVKIVMKQEQVDELVERFYHRLSNDPYFSNMFAERNVDLGLLKERQRLFIARLANVQTLADDKGEVQQVQQRHSFGVHPEKAEAWFTLMKETMEEMQLEPDIMNPLLEKIRYLVDHMIGKAAK
jgi:peroxiredoxin-like protein